MATTEAADPRTLKNWEDAFQYSVPTVRGMEKRLRSSLTENQEKLRTLVGASYRDLLNTARTIIEINGQLLQVEVLLGDASRKTDSRNLDKVGRNVARFERQKTQIDIAGHASSSQSFTLRTCLALVAKLLKTRGSSLLAAKLLVLGRLLHKSLSKDAEETDHLETLATRIGSLRERLLRHIDRRIAGQKSTADQLAQNLTAFSFVTSSSPADALAHFLRVRAAAVEHPRRPDESSIPAGVIGRLDLFLSTLSLSRQVFPDLMTASLKKLASGPLLSDQSISDLDALRLDVHARWLGEEVRNYTPWARHDELRRSQTAQALRDWAVRMMGILPTVIERDLSGETDVSALASVRKDVLQSWLSSRRVARNLVSRDALKRLQDPFILRFKSIAEGVATDMRQSISNGIISRLETWDAEREPEAPPSLWDSSMQAMDISDGASTFRDAIINRRHGRTADSVSLSDEFDRCEKKIIALQLAIKSMRDARWDDDYDDDSASADDDDNDGDQDAPDSILTQLSRKDPDQVQALLRSNVTDAIDALQSTLETTPLLSDLDSSHSRAPGVFVLRSLRALRARIPPLLSALNASTGPLQPVFCSSLVSSIHNTLATAVDVEAAPKLTTALDRLVKRSLRVRALWDGKPPLPLQPSPGTFQYLKVVLRSMEGVGADLWTTDVVKVLKTMVAERVSSSVIECIATVKESKIAKENADATPTDKEDDDDSEGEKAAAASSGGQPGGIVNGTEDEAAKNEKRDKLTQLLFDAVYLQQALATLPRGARRTAADIDPLDATMQQLIHRTSADEASVGRIEKNARDYWRRTYLLFGLLVP